VALRLDQAVCLRQWDWSETSQTVTLFARDSGLLRGLAKGSRRPRGTFSGGLEPLTAGELQFIHKPNAELFTLAAWDLTETFPGVRSNLRAHYAGLYFADLVQRTLSPLDPHPLAFDALLAALRQLSDPRTIEPALLRFQFTLLQEAGFRPTLDRLVTGEPLLDAPSHTFDPLRGGLVESPSHIDPSPANHWRIRASTVQLLLNLDAAPETLASAPADSLKRGNRFLAAYWRHVLGEQPPTMAWLFPDVDPSAPPLPRSPG